MSFYYKWQNKREVHLKYVYIQRDDPVFVTGSCRGLFIFLCGSVNQNSIKILKTEKRNPFHFFVCKQWRRHREKVRNGGMRFEVYINWTLYSISYGFWPPNSNKYGTQLYNSTSSFTASASQSSTNGIILHWEISLGWRHLWLTVIWLIWMVPSQRNWLWLVTFGRDREPNVLNGLWSAANSFLGFYVSRETF